MYNFKTIFYILFFFVLTISSSTFAANLQLKNSTDTPVSVSINNGAFEKIEKNQTRSFKASNSIVPKNGLYVLGHNLITIYSAYSGPSSSSNLTIHQPPEQTMKIVHKTISKPKGSNRYHIQ